MKTLEEVRQCLVQVRLRLLQAYQGTKVGIFGSYAWQEQTETSDVNVLIDYDQAPTLFKLVELREYLGEVLEMKVDVVAQNGLNREFESVCCLRSSIYDRSPTSRLYYSCFSSFK